MFWIWAGFVLLVLSFLALDLGVFHRKAHAVKTREALAWSAVWIAMGLLFAVFVYVGYEYKWMGMGVTPDAVDGQVNDGQSAAIKYVTGYVVEKSLSVDNIFVIVMVFTALAVPAIYQHRVLFWGILGALVMRGVMIAVGAQLIARFDWILYLFGAFLILTGIKMLLMKSDHGIDPAKTPTIRLARRLFPITDRFHDGHFLVRDGAGPGAGRGALMLTPLAVALIMVETTDLIFAVDSIPAIFAITADPFLVFTSNVFAILGLRSLYFALAGMIDTFRYLKPALAIVLLVVGAKMLAASWLKEVLGANFNFYLLGIVLLILACGVVASLLHGPKRTADGRLVRGQPALPPLR